MSREGYRQNKKIWTDEEKNRFKELWCAGGKMTEICPKFGVNVHTMYAYVKKWQDEGFLPQGLRKNRDLRFVGNRTNHPKKAKPKAEKAKVEKPKPFKPHKYKGKILEEKFVQGVTPIPINEEPVKCNRDVGKTCAFGAGKCANYYCDFITITGKPRGCPSAACTHYTPMSETQPRYVSNFAMRGNQSDLFKNKESEE